MHRIFARVRTLVGLVMLLRYDACGCLYNECYCNANFMIGIKKKLYLKLLKQQTDILNIAMCYAKQFVCVQHQHLKSIIFIL